jgi:hypothetical protein
MEPTAEPLRQQASKHLLYRGLVGLCLEKQFESAFFFWKLLFGIW